MLIETTVAYVWAAFMTIVTLVLCYYGFVVAGRQDLAVEPTFAASSDSSVPDSHVAD